MSQHNDYTVLFAQRQEELYVEQVRKNIDLEVKLQMIHPQFEKTKKDLETTNELLRQATVTIEQLTNKSDRYANKNDSLEIEFKKTAALKEQYEKELNSCKLKLVEIEREYSRQKEETQSLFNENNELKKGLINKKKVVKNDTDVSNATDNIF